MAEAREAAERHVPRLVRVRVRVRVGAGVRVRVRLRVRLRLRLRLRLRVRLRVGRRLLVHVVLHEQPDRRVLGAIHRGRHAARLVRVRAS